MTKRNGPAELQNFKDDSGLSDLMLGGLVGVSGVTFMNWRTGKVAPTYPYRVALQKLTTVMNDRGEVTKPGIPLDAWDADGTEALIISRARPLAQALAERG